ncbi:MAG: hypothetical protein IPF72_16120 [Chitinophagaceae bacterium]|nr:hypothetical protein [Chitinophagaceae bacterium]
MLEDTSGNIWFGTSGGFRNFIIMRLPISQKKKV